MHKAPKKLSVKYLVENEGSRMIKSEKSICYTFSNFSDDFMDHKVLWCFCYPFITRNVRPGRKELAFTRRNCLIASVVSFTYRSLKARSHHLRAMLFCFLFVEIVDLPGRLLSFVSFSNTLYHSLWQSFENEGFFWTDTEPFKGPLVASETTCIQGQHQVCKAKCRSLRHHDVNCNGGLVKILLRIILWKPNRRQMYVMSLHTFIFCWVELNPKAIISACYFE